LLAIDQIRSSKPTVESKKVMIRSIAMVGVICCPCDAF